MALDLTPLLGYILRDTSLHEAFPFEKTRPPAWVFFIYPASASNGNQDSLCLSYRQHHAFRSMADPSGHYFLLQLFISTRLPALFAHFLLRGGLLLFLRFLFLHRRGLLGEHLVACHHCRGHFLFHGELLL
jgi:hypothetical protein